MQLTFITESLSSNSLGRTYSLWLLAQSLGWKATVLSVRGGQIWGPVKGSNFAADCRRVSVDELAQAVPAGTDLIVACKPLMDSFGLALKVSAACGKPLLLDVDDPDLEARMRTGRPVQMIARAMRRPVRAVRDLSLHRNAMSLPTIVSNPWLQARYGGHIVPHARDDQGSGVYSSSRAPHLAFVGTNRRHKGVDLLRDAVAELQDQGFTLSVTDNAPANANPWENWLGQTSFDAGMKLVRDADIVAIPSLRTRHSEGQLPAKLIDAMLLGRPVVVSDVAPLPWAAGDGGLVIRSGSVSDLRSALLQLQDPARREQVGRAGRARALRMFATDAVSGAFERACLEAAASRTEVA